MSTSPNDDCLFCKIVSKKIPSQVIFENDRILGFRDIHPKAPIHYLFITKEHFASLAEIPKNKLSLMTDLMSAIQDVTEKEKIVSQGYKTVIHTGKGGGQEVFHIHVHLMSGR